MNKNDKPLIGFIYFKHNKDPSDELLIKLLEKKAKVIRLPLEEQVDFKEIKQKTEGCKTIFNNTTWTPILFESLELSKTLEELGKKVVDSSHSFFYQEDRWMFYLKCLEHRLPTPKTYLILKETRFNSKLIKDILETKPLVLKAIFSDNGEYIEKVSSYQGFSKKLSQLSKKVGTSPIIAQEFVPNYGKSYRVTLINHKICQAVVKKSDSWKQTGNEKKAYLRKVKITPKLKKLCERASHVFGMEVCGIDLVLHDGKWTLIEVNSCPDLGFINSDKKRLIQKLVDYLCSIS